MDCVLSNTVMVWVFFSAKSAGCFLLRAEGFSWRLKVLYGDLGISLLQFLIKKNFRCIFFFKFGHQNPGSGFTWNAGPGSGSTTLSGSATSTRYSVCVCELGERKAARDPLHGGLHHPHHQRPPLQGRLRRLPHGGESTVLLFIFKGTPSSQIRSACEWYHWIGLEKDISRVWKDFQSSEPLHTKMPLILLLIRHTGCMYTNRNLFRQIGLLKCGRSQQFFFGKISGEKLFWGRIIWLRLHLSSR